MKQATLYNELLRCYNHSRRKLQRLATEGKNLRKQDILQRRIVRLFKTLTGLQRTLKLGMATAALCAGMVLFQPNAAKSQVPITFGTLQANPFGLSGAYHSHPSFADLDEDGDMDLIAVTYGEDFLPDFEYFQNTGTATAPAFAAGQINPFGLVPVYTVTMSTSFTDLDGDGDTDLVVGDWDGNFFYYQNTGAAAAPAFAAPLSNPYGLFAAGERSTPAFADLDGDGDMDLLTGEIYGWLHYFQNTGSDTTPAFASPITNPFGLHHYPAYYTAPAFADLDDDGDFDVIFSGSSPWGLRYCENAGTKFVPDFLPFQVNPFGLTDGWQPSFADLDGDGDEDLMIGGFSGFGYYENTTIAGCNGLTVFADADNDSYGDAANSLTVAGCVVPSGYVENNTDCDDANSEINPGVSEIFNGLDDNCNGIIDDIVCNAPTGLETKNLTATSVKFKWEYSAASYKLRYKEATTGSWTLLGPTGQTKTVEGLLANTKYVWQVKSVCNVDPKITSEWSEKQFFTTTPLRMGDERATTIQIYPNPTSEKFILDLRLNSASNQPATIYLLNTLGQVVYSSVESVGNGELIKTITMPSTSAAGWYVVRVVMSNQVIEQKLLYQQ